MNMSHMFENCNSLTSLDISNFITNEIIDISSMFKSCSLLTSLDILNFNAGKVLICLLYLKTVIDFKI